MESDNPAEKTPRRVSVVMATYNGARFLREQLDSIAAQTRLPDELLIIDDGSTDGTLALLTEWAQGKPWVRIDRNPRNLGINATFWRLLNESTGSHVFISDQDDVWMPEKIERMMARADDAILAFSDAEIIDGDGNKLSASEMARHAWRKGLALSAYFFVHGNVISGHNMVVHRWLIAHTPEPPAANIMMYDQWLALSAALQGGFTELDAPLARHRIHSQNANNNKALNKAAAAKHNRRARAVFLLHKRAGIYTALGRFAGKDPGFDRFVQEVQAGFRGIETRFWTPRLFRTLWTRRELLFPLAHWRKSLRRCLKTSLGGKGWAFM